VSAQHETTLAELAGELYGALLESRPYVHRRVRLAMDSGNMRAAADAERTLERVDAALADAGDYLEASDG
jgi:hypothetical protein